MAKIIKRVQKKEEKHYKKKKYWLAYKKREVKALLVKKC